MSAIGVFDSGVGGLTVLASLKRRLPHCDFVYLGDTARLPYGSKSPDTIRSYLLQNMNFLVKEKVSALVVACNSASTQVREDLHFGVPIYNVIDPGAAAAINLTHSGKIGLVATRATVESKAYQNKVTLKASTENKIVQIFPMACPLLVPLAEEGWLDDPITNLIVYRYLQPLLACEIDSLILGCTHYPLLLNSIKKALSGRDVEIIDSGEVLAEIVASDVHAGKIQCSQNGQLKVYTTDWSAHLESWGSKILNQTQDLRFEHVQILNDEK